MHKIAHDGAYTVIGSDHCGKSAIVLGNSLQEAAPDLVPYSKGKNGHMVFILCGNGIDDA